MKDITLLDLKQLLTEEVKEIEMIDGNINLRLTKEDINDKNKFKS